MQLRKCKEILVDEEIIKKKQNEAQLLGIEYNTIEDAEAVVAKVKEEWEQMKIKGAEMHEKELLDYHPVELCEEDDKMIKKKKKMLSGIKRTLSRIHTF